MNAGPQLGAKAEIEFELASWTGHDVTDMEPLNKVLRRFRKKM